MLTSIKDLTVLEEDKILGEGAFSEVIKVRHNKDNKIYALKKINLNTVSQEDIQNLKSEIKLHKTLSHPHITKFYDNMQQKNMLYLLLEYAGNGNMFFYIHTYDGLPELLALRFLYQTALAIKYLHDRDIIHRDLKPENILFDEQFNVKICDLGWSCVNDEDDFRTSVCGTYEYMSPEIVLKNKHNSKVDIWCLGVLLYEMLHGQPPFAAENLDEIKQELAQPSIMVEDSLDPDTKGFMQYLLKDDDQQRYSIDQVLQHPAITKNKKYFEQPISQDDYAILLRNYLLNTENHDTRNFPDCLENIIQFQPGLKNEENVMDILREYVKQNFPTKIETRTKKKVFLNQPIPNLTPVVHEFDYEEYQRNRMITFKKKSTGNLNKYEQDQLEAIKKEFNQKYIKQKGGNFDDNQMTQNNDDVFKKVKESVVLNKPQSTENKKIFQDYKNQSFQYEKNTDQQDQIHIQNQSKTEVQKNTHEYNRSTNSKTQYTDGYQYQNQTQQDTYNTQKSLTKNQSQVFDEKDYQDYYRNQVQSFQRSYKNQNNNEQKQEQGKRYLQDQNYTQFSQSSYQLQPVSNLQQYSSLSDLQQKRDNNIMNKEYDKNSNTIVQKTNNNNFQSQNSEIKKQQEDYKQIQNTEDNSKQRVKRFVRQISIGNISLKNLEPNKTETQQIQKIQSKGISVEKTKEPMQSNSSQDKNTLVYRNISREKINVPVRNQSREIEKLHVTNPEILHRSSQYYPREKYYVNSVNLNNIQYNKGTNQQIEQDQKLPSIEQTFQTNRNPPIKKKVAFDENPQIQRERQAFSQNNQTPIKNKKNRYSQTEQTQDQKQDNTHEDSNKQKRQKYQSTPKTKGSKRINLGKQYKELINQAYQSPFVLTLNKNEQQNQQQSWKNSREKQSMYESSIPQQTQFQRSSQFQPNYLQNNDMYYSTRAVERKNNQRKQSDQEEKKNYLTIQEIVEQQHNKGNRRISLMEH